ncbi:MAG: hypothetical protein ACTSXD_08755, partial [Candidatus Heimdallarchaeaceae archaeon]
MTIIPNSLKSKRYTVGPQITQTEFEQEDGAQIEIDNGVVGDVLVGAAIVSPEAAVVPQRLAIGTNKQILESNGTTLTYVDNDSLNIAGDPIITVTTEGATFQGSADSTTAYQFMDADGGTPILNVDTTNERVSIGTTSTARGGLNVASDTAFTTDSGGNSDTLFLIDNSMGAGIGNYGASISFSPPIVSTRRFASIASVQTGADGDQIGLSFFTHPSGTASDPMVESVIIDHDGNVGIGTDSPLRKLDVVSEDESSIIQIVSYTDTPGERGLLLLSKANGTKTVPTVVQDDDD